MTNPFPTRVYSDRKKRPTASNDHGYDAMPDRRGELRIRTVCRTDRVKWATDIGLWRVQNISNKGMRLGTDIALTIGLPIEIALSEEDRTSTSLNSTH